MLRRFVLALSSFLSFSTLHRRFAGHRETFAIILAACFAAGAASAQTATISLAWDAPTDITGVSEYRVYSRPASGAYTSSYYTASGANATNISITNLGLGSYFFQVTSAGPGGESSPSNEIGLSAEPLSLEGLSASAASGKSINAQVFSPGGTVALITTNAVINASGVIVIGGGAAGLPGTFDLRFDAQNYLARRFVNRSLSATSALGALSAGDLDNSGIINSIDYSILKQNWLSANSVSDINGDGVVNSFDYGYLKKNWFGSDQN